MCRKHKAEKNNNAMQFLFDNFPSTGYRKIHENVKELTSGIF